MEDRKEEKKPVVVSNAILDEIEEDIRNADVLSAPGNKRLGDLFLKLDSIESYIRPDQVSMQIKQLSLTEATANLLRVQAEYTISSMQDTSWHAILQNLSLKYPYEKMKPSQTLALSTQSHFKNISQRHQETIETNRHPSQETSKIFKINLVALGKSIAPELFPPVPFSLTHALMFMSTNETEKKRLTRVRSKRLRAVENSARSAGTLMESNEARKSVNQIQRDTTIERMELMYNKLKTLNTEPYRQSQSDACSSQQSSGESSASESSRKVHLTPVPYCYLCLDTESYSKSIENMFDLECLIRNQRATKRFIEDKGEREKIYEAHNIKLKSESAIYDSIYVLCDLNKKYDKKHAEVNKSEWDSVTLLGDNLCLTITVPLWKKALEAFGFV